MAELPPSTARLLEAAIKATAALHPSRQIHTLGELAKRLGWSPQRVQNFKKLGRGVSKEAALEAESELRVSASYVLQGTGSPLSSSHTQVLQGNESVAHTMSPVAFTLPPQLTWEQFVQTKVIPETFTLQVPDGALAPKLQKGDTLIFKRADTAAPRQCILVETSSGKRYMRRYAEGTGSSWQAQALDDAFISLDSERDGLRILAVMEYKKGSEI